MSISRAGLAAAVVNNRYIVVAGGYHSGDYLKTVDIIDTGAKDGHVAISGPPMNVVRYHFRMAVVGNRIKRRRLKRNQCGVALCGVLGVDYDRDE